ncbi:MAG: hypothetical protein SFX18_04155 [Pirellulales bacterium]|nr:hypothetical protein [Pirellulales bacterium]
MFFYNWLRKPAKRHGRQFTQSRKSGYRNFETLEERTVLAGNVTLSLSLGTLTITGDDLANNIAIFAGTQPGDIVVEGRVDAATGQATTINGTPQATFNITGPIVIDLRGGNDELTLKNLTSAHSWTINGGEGNDNLSVGMYVAIGGAPDPNAVDTTLTNALALHGGNGDDTLFVGRTYGNAAQTITGGEGRDTITVYNNFAGLFNLNAGAGDDNISIGYLTSVALFTADAGEGNDLLSYYGNRTAQDAYFYGRGGIDFIALDVNKYDGNLYADSGDGNDTLLFSRSVGDANLTPFMYLYTGLGDDNLLVGKYYAVENGATVLRNAGSSVYLLQIDLGFGNDTAEIAANVITSFALFMGPGNDNVTLASNLVSVLVEVEADNTVIRESQGPGNDTVRRLNNSFDVAGSGVVYVDHGVERYLYV